MPKVSHVWLTETRSPSLPSKRWRGESSICHCFEPHCVQDRDETSPANCCRGRSRSRRTGHNIAEQARYQPDTGSRCRCASASLPRLCSNSAPHILAFVFRTAGWRYSAQLGSLYHRYWQQQRWHRTPAAPPGSLVRQVEPKFWPVTRSTMGEQPREQSVRRQIVRSR